LADVFGCVAGVGLCLVTRKGSRAKTTGTGLIPRTPLPDEEREQLAGLQAKLNAPDSRTMNLAFHQSYLH
jgi:hypothetical protein